MILVADVLKTISDSKSLELFRIVALTKPDTDILISKTRLTRKQCFSRISRLMTVNRDIQYLKQQAKDNIKKYIDERLPEEYEKCIVGLNAITKEANYNTANRR
jgi:hypothetical protein